MGMPGYDSLAPAKRFGAKVKKIVSDPTNYSPVAALAASAPGMLDKLGAQTASYGSDMRDSAGPGAQGVQTAGQGIGTGFEPDAPVAKPVTSAPSPAKPIVAPTQKQPTGDAYDPSRVLRGTTGPLTSPSVTSPSTNTPQAVGSPSQSVAAPADTDAYNQAMQARNENTYASNARQGQQSQTPDPLSTRLGVLNAFKNDVNNGEYNNLGTYKLALRGLNEQEGHDTQRAGYGANLRGIEMQGQNALATGAQQGQFGMDRAKLEMGSPLHQAQVDEAGARTKLYGAQQGEYEQKVAMQKRMDSIDAELMTPGITAARTKELQAAKSRTRNSLGYDLKFDPETNQLVRLDKTTGETGPAMPKAAPTREGALAAVKAGAPKDEVNKRLVAAGLPPI
jgi:hypothetical protein